jgi:hypothetical protein
MERGGENKRAGETSGFFSFQCTYLSTPLLSPLTISFRNQTIGHFESPFITLYQVVAYLFSTEKFGWE